MSGKSGEKDVEILAVLVHAEDKSSRACPGVLHGGDEVATDGRSGQPWCAQKRTARRGYGGGQE
jgi:hypothetical protein